MQIRTIQAFIAGIVIGAALALAGYASAQTQPGIVPSVTAYQPNATSTFAGGIQALRFCITGSGCLSLSGGGGGLGTSTPWNAGEVAYVHDNGTLSSVATGTVSGSSQITVTGSRSVLGGDLTIDIAGDSIGDAQLAFNTGQNLTTLSTPTFAGLLVTASSTIGDGTQQGGLTISGGATTTLNAYFASNVGIGSTSPYATLSVTNTGSSPTVVVEDSTSPDATPFIIDASGNVGIGTSSPSAKFAIKGSGTRGFVYTASNDIERFTILDSGKMGIGTTSPGGWFSVTGNNSVIPFQTWDVGGTVGLFAGTGNGAVSAEIRNGQMSWFLGQTSAEDFTISDRTNAIVSIQDGSPANMISVLSTGRVGIGTTSPVSLLSVGGNATVGGNLTATGTLTVSGLTTLGNASTTALSATTLCLSTDCRTAWPAGGSGSSTISTSTIPTPGHVAFWSTPSSLSSIATGTIAEGTGIAISGTGYALNSTIGVSVDESASFGWTGTHDFNSAVLRLPNSASPTVNTVGDFALDLNSNQLKVSTSTGQTPAVFAADRDGVYQFATSTLDYFGNFGASGTTTMDAGNTYRARELIYLYCDTDAGTTTARIGDGTNWSPYFTCDSDGTEVTNLGTNKTFTHREGLKFELGGLVGANNWTTFTATWAITPD